MSIRVRLRPMARSAVWVKPPLLPLVTGELTTTLKPEIEGPYGIGSKLFYGTADFPAPAYLRTIDLDTLAKHTVYTHAVNRFTHWQGYYSDALGRYVLAGEYPPVSADIMTVDVPTDTVNWINLNSDEFIAIKEWGGYLYVGARITDPAHAPKTGGAIWRCPIANILNVGSWSKVYTHPNEWTIIKAHIFGIKLVFLATSHVGDIDIITTENGTVYSIIKQITGQHAAQEFPCTFRSYYAFPYLDGSRHIHVVYSTDLSSWTDWDTEITLPGGHPLYLVNLTAMGKDRMLIGGGYGTGGSGGTINSVLYETRDLESVIHVANINGSILHQQSVLQSGVIFAPAWRPSPANSGAKIMVIKPRKWRAAGEDFRVPDASAIWVEQAGALPLIWAKIANIGAGATITLYIYYGNPDVASVSSGADTFVQFDNFDDYAVDEVPKAARGWSTSGIDVNNYFKAAANPSGSGMVMKARESGDGAGTILDNSFPLVECEIGYKWYAVDADFNEAFMQMVEGATRIVWTSIADLGSTTRCKWLDGGIRNNFNPVLDIVWGSWNKFRARVYLSDYHLVLDAKDGDGGLENAMTVGIDLFQYYHKTTNPGTAFLDDFYVRKYKPPDPSVSVGSEESGSWTIAGDIYNYRRQVTIDNTGGGALSDYQVLIRFPAI